MISFLRRTVRTEFRGLVAADAASCAGLHREGFAFPWDVDEIERLIASAGVVGDGVVDRESGTLHGFILTRSAADEAEILTIAVASAQRRAGLARQLLARHLDALRLLRIKTLFLEVAQDNQAALMLYSKNGFAEVGRRPGYYRAADGQRRDAIVMSKQLL